MMEVQWGQTDQFIDQFIGLDETQFKKFASSCSPGIPFCDAVEHLLKWVRRRAVRRSEYIWPSGAQPRIRREGLPWSYVEEYIMKVAFTRRDCETPPGVEVTDEYIATFLQRTESEVREKRNTKSGIRGFDI